MRYVLFFLIAFPAFAQQQVIPMDFDRKQEKLFVKVTQAVVAPCCQNGIPVAYHNSPMATQVRDQIEGYVREGKDQREITALLEKARYGPRNDMRLTWAVPDGKSLGLLTWMVAPIAFIIGCVIIFMIVVKKNKTRVASLSEEELLERHREQIFADAGS